MRKILIALPFLFVFIASLYNSADLDLGWHLKYGEYFVQHHQVAKINTFSSEMQNYRYPNTSWASDVFLYVIFQKLGFLGITLLGALTITATFYFFSKAANLSIFQQSIIFPLLIYLLAPQNAAGFRAQLWSFLFMGILFYLLTKPSVILGIRRQPETPESLRKDSGQARMTKIVKGQLLIVPLFLIWAQLHGEYLSGLVLFGLFILLGVTMGQWDKAHKVDKGTNSKVSIYPLYTLSLRPYVPLLTIFLLSILATLINPYGINIYLESFRHFANPLQKFVIEWLPNAVFSKDWWNLVIVGITSAIGLVVILKVTKAQRDKVYKGNKGTNSKVSIYPLYPLSLRPYVPIYAITFLLLALSFWSRRYSWNFYYFAIFLIAPLVAKLEPRAKQANLFISLCFIGLAIIIALFTTFPISKFSSMNWDNYCLNYVECSPKSLKFLETLCHSGFSSESIGKIPNQVRDDNGAVQDDKDCVLYTFYDWGGYIMYNSKIKPSMDGRMALWRSDNGYSAFEKYYALQQNWQDIDKSNYNVVLINHKKPIYLHLTDLARQGRWELAYQDEIAAVFVRKK